MKLQNIVTLSLLFSTLLFAGKPDWVKSRPVSQEYYIGIGQAQRGNGISGEDLSTVAKERALNDLISEISVKIQGTGIADAEAVNDSLKERYYEEIRLETQANLTGHEFVGEYKKGKICYVYYRLRKSKWARIEQSRLQRAVSLSLKHIDNGDRALSSGDPLSAIDEYVNGYHVLLPVLYLNPRGSVGGSEKILSSFIKAKLKKVATALSLKHRTPVYNGVRKLYNSTGTKIQLAYKNVSIAHAALFIGGNEMLTTKEGIFLTTDLIGDEDTLSLTAEVAIDKLSPLCEQSAVVSSWVSTVRWPKAELRYIFRKPRLFFNSNEEMLGMESDNPTLKPTMEEQFGNGGYSLANAPGDAEVVVSLTGKTRTISAMGSLHFVYLDVTALLVDKSGKTILSKKFKPIKGGGLDYDQASIKAYEKGAAFVAKELHQWCEDNL